MSQENNNFKFNIDLLMNDVNTVIQNGMNNLLKDFITNYTLYEETHNCIMNLPSVKREISKRNDIDENYDDLPDLISMSSDYDSKYDTVKYTRIPVEYDTEQESDDQESDDTLLCMKKVANQLLKEKEDTIALYQKEKISYNDIIEKCYKQIESLKNEIDELKKCIKQPLVYDLTIEPSQEVIVEIKEEKENIILHIEENSEQTDEESGDEEEEEDGEEEEEDGEEEEEDGEEEEDDEEQEEEEDVDEEQEEEADVDEEEADEEDGEEEQEDEEDGDEEEDDEEEDVDEEDEKEQEAVVDEDQDNKEQEDNEEEADEVETENSDSDEKNQEELDENDEEELIEIEIDDVTYCTNDEDNGFIYELDKDGNVGEIIGYLKDGEPFFN